MFLLSLHGRDTITRERGREALIHAKSVGSNLLRSGIGLRLALAVPAGKLPNLSPSELIGISRQHPVLAFGTAVGIAIFLAAHYLQSPWRKLPPVSPFPF